MTEGNSPCNKRKRVSVIREALYGCGSGIGFGNVSDDIAVTTSEIEQSVVGWTASSVDRSKEVESVDSEKDGFCVAPSKRSPTRASNVKPLSRQESLGLVASPSRRTQPSRTDAVRVTRSASITTREPENSSESGGRSSVEFIPVMRRNRIVEELTPRDKVLKTLRLFKLVYQALLRERAGQQSKTLHHDTRNVLIDSGKQVNAEKMVGSVPGIEVGDEFEYKVELNLIGLHFDMMSGIDVIYEEGMALATSVVSSEGAGYDDRFNENAIIYCGCISKAFEDPMSKTTDLAMINSMKKKSPIRVIRGQKKTLNRYVYKGLYIVKDYWQENLPLGCVCFKFKLAQN